uniref:Translation initiation inhibitor n=1 Tax=Amblyomma maculatum TaxID=34609 RepID=G3MR86_AMBMU
MFSTFVSRQLGPSVLLRSMSKVTREVISSEHGPKALGPYSQAIRAGDTMYVSGQIGVDPKTGKLVEGGITAETRQALTNLSKVLEAGRMSLKCVAKCTVYLGDMKDFQEMNKVYTEFFTEKQPARAGIQRQLGHLECSTGWLLLCEKFSIHFVHFLKVFHVPKVDSALCNAFKRHPPSFQDLAQICQGLPGLGCDSTFN